MTLEEAIKTIKEELADHTPHRDTDFYKASELGIEALKQIKTIRAGKQKVRINLLPGETEDN